jgi:hypothetical protein
VALPVDAASLDEADAAIELWEHYKRRKLDDGQRLDVAVMMATRDDGLWAASVTGHEKPRQSGKGDSIEVVEFWGLTQRCERILHTIHDAVLLATETQSRMLSLFEHQDLRRLKAREWKGTGQQMIEMRSGATIWYRTRTGAGGRGVDEVDRLVVDEAQHAEPQHLNSITPTQAVSANPQLNVLGTGGLDGKSGWWWSLRRQAKGAPGRFGWVGYSAQPWDADADGGVWLGDVDPFDRDLWWSTIPGLVAGRVSIDFLERELRVLGPDGFAQEYLCVWAPPADSLTSGPIPVERWQSLTDGESLPVEGTERLSLDVTPDRRFSTFGIAGKRADGLGHVSIRHREPGTSWVVARAKELAAGHGTPVVIVKGSPAESLIPDLELAGVPVDVMSQADYAGACQRFVDAVNAHEPLIRHRGSPDHTAAVSAAQIKPAGDGGFVWSRRSTSSDITPLTTATVAWARVGHGGPAKSKTMHTRSRGRSSN